jgi:hypothetical protein
MIRVVIKSCYLPARYFLYLIMTIICKHDNDEHSEEIFLKRAAVAFD